MKIVTEKELDANTSYLINVRFTAFLVRLAMELHIDFTTMKDAAEKILIKAEIPQD